MSENNIKNKIHNYLNTLTKNELIELVLKFYPEDFIHNINGKFYNKKEEIIAFDKVLDEIESIFSDDNYLYSPSQFEKELLNQLEKIRWSWDKLPTKVGDLIVSIIEDTEEAFENGYLYLENYGKKDEYFESEDINNYFFQFTNSLQNEIKLKYVEKLKDVLANSGYSTFNSFEDKLSSTK